MPRVSLSREQPRASMNSRDSRVESWLRLGNDAEQAVPIARKTVRRHATGRASLNGRAARSDDGKPGTVSPACGAVAEANPRLGSLDDGVLSQNALPECTEARPPQSSRLQPPAPCAPPPARAARS